MSVRRNLSSLVGLALGLAHLSTAAASSKAVAIDIKVIHAHNGSKQIDAKLSALAKQFSKLSFTAYELKDEAALKLEPGASGRIQLPDGQWMSVKAQSLASDGALKLELAADKLKFKTTVSIAPGATLAVGGPPYKGGALILAVSRPAADK